MTYRPEIDGLRAIAVLAVVFFHLRVPGFTGGFVGVDVFFVVSGYLISRLILSELEAGTFSFRDFYLRRARRLFPALFFTLALTFATGALLLPAEAFADLAESNQSALLAISNFHFWIEAGYFDAAADTKPLLHTWSLGLEEQYYLIWPVLVLLMIRHVRRYLLALVGAMLVVSVVGSEIVLGHDPEAAFYLLPFRAFELLLGTLVVLLERCLAPGNTAREALLIVGLALVAWPIAMYDLTTPFPGLHALVPCFGTACAVFGGEARFSGAVLRHRLLVGTGLISYSLYLIHWPLIVFFLVWQIEDALTPLQQAAIVVASLVSAYLMYRFVELPFRRPDPARALSPAGFGLVSVSLTTGLLYLAANAWGHDGWSWRIPDRPWAADRPWMKCIELDDGHPGCAVGDVRLPEPDIMVIGDSHASVLRSAIDHLAKRNGLRANFWTFPGCPAIFGTYKIYAEARRRRQEDCQAQIVEWERHLIENPYPVVVLASRWTWLIEPANYGGQRALRLDMLVDRDDPNANPEIARRVLATKLRKTVKRLTDAGSKVVVFSEPPLLDDLPATCEPGPLDGLLGRSREDRCDLIGYERAMARLAFTNRVIGGLNEAEEAMVLPVIVSDAFCHRERQRCDIARGGRLLYRDDNHISNFGAIVLARRLREPFDALLASTPDAALK